MVKIYEDFELFSSENCNDDFDCETNVCWYDTKLFHEELQTLNAQRNIRMNKKNENHFNTFSKSDFKQRPKLFKSKIIKLNITFSFKWANWK